MAINAKQDHPENGPEGRRAKADAQAGDSTAQDVAGVLEQELTDGFRGLKADPTPNENYTVAGVTSGAPTPETDKGLARQVRDHQDDVEAKAEGVARNDS